jgi:hypothetical protein
MRIAIFVLIILAMQEVAQTPPAAPLFRDSKLVFRFSPPANMRDLTAVDRQSIQQRAAALGTSNTLTLLLSLRSGPDDTAADWHSVGIETYPREKLGTVSDRDASRTFSRRVAGAGTEIGQAADLDVGGCRFAVSIFELREGQLTKHARVYTTVRNGRMLSFAFSANSPDVLARIVESMKTFKAE